MSRFSNRIDNFEICNLSLEQIEVLMKLCLKAERSASRDNLDHEADSIFELWSRLHDRRFALTLAYREEKARRVEVPSE